MPRPPSNTNLHDEILRCDVAINEFVTHYILYYIIHYTTAPDRATHWQALQLVRVVYSLAPTLRAASGLNSACPHVGHQVRCLIRPPTKLELELAPNFSPPLLPQLSPVREYYPHGFKYRPNICGNLTGYISIHSQKFYGTWYKFDSEHTANERTVDTDRFKVQLLLRQLLTTDDDWPVTAMSWRQKLTSEGVRRRPNICIVDLWKRLPTMAGLISRCWIACASKAHCHWQRAELHSCCCLEAIKVKWVCAVKPEQLSV